MVVFAIDRLDVDNKHMILYSIKISFLYLMYMVVLFYMMIYLGNFGDSC